MRFTRSSLTKSATAKLAASHPAFRFFFWYAAREDRRNASRDVQRITLRPGDRLVITRSDPKASDSKGPDSKSNVAKRGRRARRRKDRR